MIGEPVTRLDPPFDVLLPLLIQVDTALLDRATGLALRFGEPGPDERIHEREGVLVVDRRRGNLLRERLPPAASRCVRVELAAPAVSRDHRIAWAGAVDQLRRLAG